MIAINRGKKAVFFSIFGTLLWTVAFGGSLLVGSYSKQKEFRQQWVQASAVLLRNDLLESDMIKVRANLAEMMREVSNIQFVCIKQGHRIHLYLGDNEAKIRKKHEEECLKEASSGPVYSAELLADGQQRLGELKIFFESGLLTGLRGMLDAYTVLLFAIFAIAAWFWFNNRNRAAKTEALKAAASRMGDESTPSDDFVREYPELSRKWSQMHETISSSARKLADLEIQAQIGSLAAQVSHDIKSPLTALEMVTSDLSSLPEDKRILIRNATTRIKDIANNLLQRNRELAKAKVMGLAANAKTPEARSPQILSNIIESILSEKRAQFGNRPQIELISSVSRDALCAFASVQPTEFKRLISNLLNNAVEALSEQGRVTVALDVFSNKIQMSVADDGKGIPKEVLSKLGQRGATHGKEGGSGLGLYHARKSIEAWGGSLELRSEVGKGTTVLLSIAKEEPPKWFVSELILSPKSTVVILDDDSSIHGVWKARFEGLKLKDFGIEVFHFSTSEELDSFFENSSAASNAIILTDYELLGQKESGLDLVERHKIQSKSILISSRFEEPVVQERCARLGMKLLPKDLAAFVPISIKQPAQKWDAVLLDDDELVHSTWSMVAKQNGMSLRSFYNAQNLFQALAEIHPESPIYVDSNLGGGVRGQDLIPKIHLLGFRRLFLTTGYEAESVGEIPGLVAVFGKEPPFLNSEREHF